MSGQIRRRLVLDRLDMGTAAASERHQFRVRAQLPKDANTPHAGAALRQTNSGGLSGLMKSQ
jgi:hypothetical protein